MSTKQNQREHGKKMQNVIPFLFGVGIFEMTNAADDIQHHKQQSTRYSDQ